MRNRSFFRVIIVMVGIIATIAIVLSQALPEQSPEKAQTEQTDQDNDVIILPTPSDVVPGGIVQVNDAHRSLLEIFINEDPKTPVFECDDRILSEYLSILFRAIISPNAP